MAAGEPRVNSLLGRLTPYYSKALGHALHMARYRITLPPPTSWATFETVFSGKPGSRSLFRGLQ